MTRCITLYIIFSRRLKCFVSSVMTKSSPFPPQKNVFDDDDGWQDMPIVREDIFASGLDEEDQRKYQCITTSPLPKAKLLRTPLENL